MVFECKISCATYPKYNISRSIFYIYPISLILVQFYSGLWSSLKPREYPLFTFPWLTDLPSLGPRNISLLTEP